MNIKYKLTDLAISLEHLFAEQGKQISFHPTRGTPLSAGMDLKACTLDPIDIRPYETVKVMTGLQIWLGERNKDMLSMWNYELAGLYLPRSSNKGLQLENTVGLLDCDYQGESFLKLYNKTEDVITIQPGERIAQLIVIPVIMDEWEEVQSFDTTTERGEGGDGSTGKT